MKLLAGSIFLAATQLFGSAQSFLFDVGGAAIPDGDPRGFSDTRTVTLETGLIESVGVTLNVKGGFNGDLYVQLNHAGVFSVLLNQAGLKTTDPVGYSDSGFSVMLSDAALSGDIHSYRFSLFGTHSIPIDGPLTGIWAPDGRPLGSETEASSLARTKMLSEFAGLSADGAWTIFLLDKASGGEAKVQSWGLNIQTIPEPGAVHLLWVGFGFFLLKSQSSRSRHGDINNRRPNY